MRMIINTDRTKCKTAADCIRIDLCGGFSGYGVQIIRGWRTVAAAHVMAVTVRQTGKRHIQAYLRAFGRSACFDT
jgi:hypothetical protein